MLGAFRTSGRSVDTPPMYFHAKTASLEIESPIGSTPDAVIRSPQVQEIYMGIEADAHG